MGWELGEMVWLVAEMDADGVKGWLRGQIWLCRRLFYDRSPGQGTCPRSGIIEQFENFGMPGRKWQYKLSMPINFCSDLTSVGTGIEIMGLTCGQEI
jgi:hypothetical protein